MFLLLNTSKFPSTSLLCSIEKQIKVLKSNDCKEFSKNVIFLHCVRDNISERNSQIFSIANYVIGLYRKNLLHKNEQQTVLSFTQQLIVIQIVLHQLNMDQPSVGEVKNILNKIIERKLIKYSQIHKNENLVVDDLLPQNPVDTLLRKSDNSKNFEYIFSGYFKFMKNSNVVDFADVVKSLSLEFPINSETEYDTMVLINNGNLSRAEVAIITHLLQSTDNYFLIKTSSHGEDQPVVITPSAQPEILDMIKERDVGNCLEFVKSIKSASEVYAEHLILSYLALLVNSRSELALAATINIPERGVDHHRFTEIKHSAASKNLSMYQTITSFVLRSRLGGKGYSPSPEDPMTQMLKGLSEFTDLYNKLHSIIEEEDIDIRSATIRLVKFIKNTLCKTSQAVSLPSPPSRSVSSHFLRPIKRGDLEVAATKILSSFESLLKSMESLDPDITTPTRMINEGASVNGRRTLRIIRDLLDLHATCDGDDDDGVLVADTVLTQTGSTPMRSLASLASKFKSPNDEVKSSWRSLFSQNKDANDGFKRHRSTPDSTSKRPKKPKPLFSRAFSSPSENKENIPPEDHLPKHHQRQPPPAKTANLRVLKATVKKVQRTSKRSLFKNSDTKNQTTMKQFLH